MDRRSFLKELGLIGSAGALVSMFPWLESCSEQKVAAVTGEKVRLGIIGTGSRGQYHINNLHRIPAAQIVALCDDYRSNLDVAAALCPDAKLYEDYRELLASKEVDAVLIATPLNWHEPMTLDALSAGKHVFCEKAMTMTAEGCRRMYDAWKASGRVMFIGQQRLFDPKYIKAFGMIHDGGIGTVCGLRNYWYRNNDWRRPVPSPELERRINWRLYRESSCGLMTELGCHHLQNGTWAMRMLPDSVAGYGDLVYWRDDRGVYDNVSVIYHYPNGVKMTFESIISNKHFGMGEQILGSEGTIALESGMLYPEQPRPRSGIRQLLGQIEQGVFSNAVFAGTSWTAESGSTERGIVIAPVGGAHDGSSMIGAVDDGSEQMMEAFCQAAITGEQPKGVVEEAYYASVLSLLGLQAMEEKRIIPITEEYHIPYL